MPTPALTASDKLAELGQRHDELLARIDELNAQVLDALERISTDDGATAIN